MPGFNATTPRDWRKELDAVYVRLDALEAKASLPSAADLDAVVAEQEIAVATKKKKKPANGPDNV